MLFHTAKRTFKALLITVISVLFITFAVFNRETVHLSLFPLPYTAAMPAFLFAIFWFTLGLVIGWMALRFKLSQSQRMVKAEHKQVMALQNELGTMHHEQSAAPLTTATLPKA